MSGQKTIGKQWNPLKSLCNNTVTGLCINLWVITPKTKSDLTLLAKDHCTMLIITTSEQQQQQLLSWLWNNIFTH